MKKTIQNFSTKDFYTALSEFFDKLNIPVNYLAEEPARAQDILSQKNYKDNNEAFQVMDDVYFLGMVDDATFEGNAGLDPAKIESDYDGILIFGVTLNPRENGLLPTRSQLAEITRSFNREFHYTPVVVIFKYANHIAFANAQRLKFKQEWREGEKAGKVSLLRDIDLATPHSGHLQILQELAITRRGKKGINSFAALYAYWQEVFNVSLLNKKFYEELSNWYFWAVKEVTFPSEPTIHSLFEETGSNDDAKLQEAIQEHKAKNVIRLLTRFLFVWFIKEKKLIPEKLFDPEYLKGELLEDLSAFHPTGPQGDLFQSVNIKSSYYKAILQNLFFATLNQEMNKRGFRNDKQHMNVTNLLRYESCFKNGQKFVELVESVVPFMNGGLFECLDKPHPAKKGPKGGDVIVYKDGFSDRKDNPLKVPDYLFFGLESEVDLSSVIGIKNKKTKQAAVKGLINIFNSYKFTIAENTPIEEDVALDPELLGKVFENLLASYNPETKTTARKQTGSFYTPREIVNYMVDESLIAYLKNAINTWDMADDELDAKLHELFSFDPINPFADSSLQKEIIAALDRCTILDPACGSGAFPMGILQKIVHILHKIDPQNCEWKQRQIDRVDKAISSLEEIDDPHFRKTSIRELEIQKRDIEEAFANNELDYGRKLFLIENCIYGVDIQPIAVQISKLRFFISLVVDQKVDKTRDNFGILPLPNLETKFVAANSLIGIEKHEKQISLGNPAIQKLEKELKNIRHRIFSAKTPKTKRKLHLEDQQLRKKMGELLIADGWENKTARQLADWDPYDQNASSGFFDPEWMFGVSDGFDVVIGNPPYVQIQKFPKAQKEQWVSQGFKTYAATADIYCLFYERGAQLLKRGGHLWFITSNKWMRTGYGKTLRSYLSSEVNTTTVLDFGMAQNFGEATTYTNILGFENSPSAHKTNCCYASDDKAAMADPCKYFSQNAVHMPALDRTPWVVISSERYKIKQLVEAQGIPLEQWDLDINYGIKTGFNEAFYLTQEQRDELIAREPKAAEIIVPLLRGRYVERYGTNWDKTWMIGTFPSLHLNIDEYPVVKKYLENYLPKLKQTGETFTNADGKKERTRKKTQNKWFETQDSIACHKEFLKPKIIYPNMTKYLPFYYDGVEHFFGNQKCFIMTSKSVSLQYVTALLNSALFKCCFRDNFPELLGNTYELSKIFFEKIPLKKPTAHQSALFSPLVEIIQDAKSRKIEIAAVTIEGVIDGLICQLYFSDHMQEKQIDILQFVEQDLAEVMQNRDFDQLPDKEKEEIINQLHARWTHPDSEVRNRIKLFAVRSPDILKPILESR